MRRIATLATAVLLVFVALLLARFPARWAGAWLPEGVQCRSLSGTVWNGRCEALTLGGAPLGDARWNVRESRLAVGRLAALVVLAKGGVDVKGELESGAAGGLTARNVQAVVRLDPAVLPQLPPDLRGTIRADLVHFAASGPIVTAIEGRIEALGLARVGSARALALGDYAVTFPPGATDAEPVGILEDLRGPLDVNGTLRLTREPGWVVEGTVAARGDAPPWLVRDLQYLGRPDAAGRRAFSIAGTY